MKKILLLSILLLASCTTQSNLADDEKKPCQKHWASEDDALPIGGAFDQSAEAKARFNCFLKAAEAGNALAQMTVANMYMVSHGTSENRVEAQKWARKGAEQGDPDAQYVFAEGLFGTINPEESAFWYKKSAEQGFSLAQQGVAVAYLNGIGVPQSDVHTLAWALVYKAQTGDEIGLYVDGVRKRMTPAQISDAQKESEDLFDTINKNRIESCNKFGDKYDKYGVHCFKDKDS